MDNFSINITRSGRLQQIIDRLKQQQNMNVKVGILDDPETAKYASCVEFGWTQRVTPKQHYAFAQWWGINLPINAVLHNPPRPFLRSTLWHYSHTWAVQGVNVLIRSNFNMETALAFIGQIAGQDVQCTIAGGGVQAAGQSFDLRSEFTMHVYSLRGGDGTGNVNTTRPMVLTGKMLHSITYRVDRN